MTDPSVYASPYSPFVLGLRWVYFHACELIAFCSLLANLLPHEKRFARFPRVHWWYVFLVDYIALFALNIRANLPCIELELFGFRRKIRHGYRNWRQRRMDRQHLDRQEKIS